MPYDPIRLLRQSWPSPDDLARELFVLFTEGAKALPPAPASAEPSPVRRVPPRPAARPPVPVLPPRPIERVVNQPAPVVAQLAPTRLAPAPPEGARAAPESPPPLRPETFAADRALQPPVQPLDQAPGVTAGLTLTQFSYDAFPGAPSPPPPPSRPTGPLPAVVLPPTSVPEPGFPTALRMESATTSALPPGLRSVPPAEPALGPAEILGPEPATRTVRVAGLEPQLLLGPFPTGTREVPPELPKRPAFTLEKVRLSDVPSQPLGDSPDGQAVATPIPYTANPYPQPMTALLEVDEDGVTGFKPPVSTGDGEGVPGRGKAYVLDYDGDHLSKVDSDPMEVVNLGSPAAPGLVVQGIRIYERSWWIQGGDSDAFFADFLTIAASPGALSGLPALHSTTGDVYAIVRGAWKKVATNARIYNGMPNATDNTKRQILASNGDGTFTVITQSCTAP
jgi:hypothetical protein